MLNRGVSFSLTGRLPLAFCLVLRYGGVVPFGTFRVTQGWRQQACDGILLALFFSDLTAPGFWVSLSI